MPVLEKPDYCTRKDLEACYLCDLMRDDRDCTGEIVSDSDLLILLDDDEEG